MALSLDDRLMGERVENYCSSSEDEAEPDTPTFIPEPETSGKYTVNTGPKGVINDWRRFKQLETERREEQELEKMELAKKLSMTCRSELDDEREKAKDDELLEQLEELEDEFIKEYRNKRLEEMRETLKNVPKFGEVVNLNKQDFVNSVDKEHPSVLVVVHIYEENVPACIAMNGCLMCLAKEYTGVKFCKVKASETKLSINFSHSGVPALLIYKNKELIGNFVRLSDEFGEDFYATDVQSYLIEHGFLTDQTFQKNLRSITQDSDSDLEGD